MPTLFGRRYMRDRVPTTERVIGIACLLITAGVVVAFIADSGTQRPPLFSVDPAKQPPAIPPEQKHARQLLPESPAPGWVCAEPVEAAGPEGIERAMPGRSAALVELGFRRTYAGRYLNRVDARQQLTARILDFASAQAARDAFDVLRPKEAVGEPVGVRGWRHPDGSIGFQSGRYVNLITATNVPADSLLTPTLLAREVADRQVAYDAIDPAELADRSRDGKKPDAAAQPELLPTAGPGWMPPERIATYNPGNLWEKINGRAEQYLAFDFERLVFGTYRSANGSASVDCYVYEMREPVKAFGIYQAEMAEHPDPIELGRGGYRGRGSIFFWKGKGYVQLVEGEGGGVGDEPLLALARAIADWLPDDEAGGLWAEKVFPRAGQVEGSFTYLAQNAFSLDFLKDVYSADYEADGARLTLFVHQAADDVAAATLLEQYAAYVAKLGKVQSREALPDGELLVGDFGGEFDIIFTKGRYFGGATLASDPDAGRRLAIELRDALK